MVVGFVWTILTGTNLARRCGTDSNNGSTGKSQNIWRDNMTPLEKEIKDLLLSAAVLASRTAIVSGTVTFTALLVLRVMGDKLW